MLLQRWEFLHKESIPFSVEFQYLKHQSMKATNPIQTKDESKRDSTKVLHMDTETASIIFRQPTAPKMLHKLLQIFCSIHLKAMRNQNRSRSVLKVGGNVTVLVVSNTITPLTSLSLLRTLHNPKSGIMHLLFVCIARENRTLQFTILVFYLSSCRIKYDPPLVPFSQLTFESVGLISEKGKE